MDSGVPEKPLKSRPVADAWPAAIYRALKQHRIRQVSYVPDAGHKRLIELCHADRSMAVVPLTTEEEGIGLAAGAWLGGERAALLMLITMRGEIGETNPWQIPMGRATPETLRLGGVRIFRLDRAADASARVSAAARLAFDRSTAAAVTISQRMIGIKSFEEKQ